MDSEELRKKENEELNKLAIDLRGQLTDLRFTKAANQLKNTKDASAIKKDIARVLTILRENRK